MPKIRPDEYWKATLYMPFKKVERTFRGKSGRKRALEWVGREKKKNYSIYRATVEGCIPSWELAWEWEDPFNATLV